MTELQTVQEKQRLILKKEEERRSKGGSLEGGSGVDRNRWRDLTMAERLWASSATRRHKAPRRPAPPWGRWDRTLHNRSQWPGGPTCGGRTWCCWESRLTRLQPLPETKAYHETVFRRASVKKGGLRMWKCVWKAKKRHHNYQFKLVSPHWRKLKKSGVITTKNRNITTVLASLQWLPVHFRIHFKSLRLSFQIFKGLTPSYFCDSLVRAHWMFQDPN